MTVKAILSIIILLGSLMSCNKDSKEFLPITVLPADQPACFNSRPVIRQSNDLTGRISYSKDQNTYFISYGVPGTYDSVWVGYVCNLPDEFRVLNKQVVFSGEYREAPEILGRFGGEENYYLFLTAIR